MRIILISLIIIFVSAISTAQDTLHQTNDKALVFVYTGSGLGYLGAKYFILNQLAVQGTFYFGNSKRNDVVNDPSRESSSNEYRPGIGLQYIAANIDGLYFLGLIDFAAGFGETHYSDFDVVGNLVDENSSSSTSYYLTFGIGIEYWLAKSLSLSGVQSFTWSKSSLKISDARIQGIGNTVSSEQVAADNSRLILSFYF